MGNNEGRTRSWAIELLKYPITVFSILAAVIIAKYTLGVSFGPVSKLSASGVEFFQDAGRSLAELESKLNGALVEIDALKKSYKGNEVETAQIKSKIFAASQQASDQTVAITRITSEKSGGTPQRGYIWIGDFKTVWQRTMIGDISTGQPISLSPDRLQPSTEYKALGNMFVRDGLPPNDAEYFRAKKIVGTIGRGTRIRLLTSPKGIDREFAVQYWAEVEAL